MQLKKTENKNNSH